MHIQSVNKKKQLPKDKPNQNKTHEKKNNVIDIDVVTRKTKRGKNDWSFCLDVSFK